MGRSSVDSERLESGDGEVVKVTRFETQVDPVWFDVEVDNHGSTNRTVSGSLTRRLSGRNAERGEWKGKVNGRRLIVLPGYLVEDRYLTARISIHRARARIVRGKNQLGDGQKEKMGMVCGCVEVKE